MPSESYILNPELNSKPQSAGKGSWSSAALARCDKHKRSTSDRTEVLWDFIRVLNFVGVSYGFEGLCGISEAKQHVPALGPR